MRCYVFVTRAHDDALRDQAARIAELEAELARRHAERVREIDAHMERVAELEAKIDELKQELRRAHYDVRFDS